MNQAIANALRFVWLIAFPALLHGAPGSLDTGFGDGGTLALPVGGAATGVACQADGKIVVGGSFGVVRLNRDGRFDESFGTGGQVTVGRSTNRTETVGALLVQPDGKIVVAIGNALARLLPSGALDTGFGEGGFALGQAVPFYNDFIATLKLQPDGRIIAAGISSVASAGGMAFMVLRFLPDGANDPSFGIGGRAVTSFGSSTAICRAVTWLPDGRIVAGGGVMVENRIVFGLAQFATNGVLEAGFGKGGETIVPLAGSTFGQINGLAIQSNGKIIAAGVASTTNGPDFAVVRLNPDGSVDESFGTDGRVRTDVAGGSRDIVSAVAVMPDERIIVAGSSGPNVFSSRFAFACYRADGSLDERVGEGGRVTTQFAQSHSDESYEAALTGDGRVILAGRSATGDTEACAIAQYHVADLAVSETASLNPVAVGDTFYYAVEIENNRADGVTGVRLIDDLPSSVDFKSAYLSQGTGTNVGNRVVGELGFLASGGKATVTIFVTMHATAHLCNTVVVSANETDPNLTNAVIACATVDAAREAPRNLAVTRIVAPKRVVLSPSRPEKTQVIAVEIQNRSPRVEQIADLNGVVDLEVRSLTNSCPDLVPVLLMERPQAQLPVFLSPHAKLKVYFRVTYSKDCVPDPDKTDRSEVHNDYEYVARVNRAVVDDNRDTFPRDDTCPRSPAGSVTTDGSRIQDLGCGGKVYLVGFGAAIVTDVIVK
jgi:uncharacterized delta-60 repeat protein/uncharacterized repeat protein (TIGR01451 family)